MRTRRVGSAWIAALLAVGALAVPASADARPPKPVIAVGDQKADMFSDPRLKWLGIRHARLVVPWYIESLGTPEEKAQVRSWLEAARANGIEPLVGFGHGWIGWTRIYLPTVKEFRAAFDAFRKSYPWVRTYITWNEANHCSQPTCTKPRRTAKFYDYMVRKCRGCRIVAAAVLTAGNMRTWIRRFERAAKHRTKLWGLHNYGDVNRLNWKGTREFLRLVKRKPVWITESGGVVYRARYGGQDPFPVGSRRAGRVTKYLLRVASRHRARIRRIYLYHWNVDRPKPQWDSGLIDWAGRARSGFSAVARYLGRNPRMAPTGPDPPPAPPPPPPPAPPPDAENPPSPPPGDEPPPQEPPPEECSLVVLCPPILGLAS